MRFKPVLFALLMVVASVAGPGVGPAAAVHDCNTTDALVFGFSFGAVNKDKCTNNHVYHAVEEVRDAETNQTKVDIYSAASGQSDQAADYNVLYTNYLQDTETTAWSKAEVAIAEAYKNGSTKAEAKVAAKEAISKYYAQKQINLINSWNTSVDGIHYLDERKDQEGIAHNYITYNYYYPSSGNDIQSSTKDVFYGDTTSLTLVNSSTRNAEQFWVYGTTTADNTYNESVTVTTGEVTYYESMNDFDEGYVNYLKVKPPDANYNELEYLRFNDYKTKWSDIEAKNSELQTESGTFVDSIWTDLEAGNIDSTDVVSRNTLMFEYGSTSQGSNGTYYDTIGAAAGMGLSTPDLNGTGTMTVTTHVNGNQYEGMLFGDPPNATWDVGTRYNSANITSPVFFATTDGQFFEITGEFTVDSATDKEGTSRMEVTTQTYNYKTSNTSQLNDQMLELLELTQELQERSEAVGSEPTGGGGGGGVALGGLLDFLSIGNVPGEAVAAGGVGGYLLLQRGGGTSGLSARFRRRR